MEAMIFCFIKWFVFYHRKWLKYVQIFYLSDLNIYMNIFQINANLRPFNDLEV